MAVIKLNRTETGVVPTALEDGELYLDQLNSKLYWADATGAVRMTELQQFVSGTKMIFRQTSAPTGWTKATILDDTVLRVVSGSTSYGGSVGFSAAFATGVTAGGTTLTTNQIPAHSHGITDPGHVHGHGAYAYTEYTPGGSYKVIPGIGNTLSATTGITINNAGGGQSHNHTLPMADLKYADVIIATKD